MSNIRDIFLEFREKIEEHEEGLLDENEVLKDKVSELEEELSELKEKLEELEKFTEFKEISKKLEEVSYDAQITFENLLIEWKEIVKNPANLVIKIWRFNNLFFFLERELKEVFEYVEEFASELPEEE